MLKHKKRIPSFASNCLRRCLLTVTAFVTMSVATTTFANFSCGHQGPTLNFRGFTAMALGIPTARPYDNAETVVSVANAEELYAAVNDPTNTGAAIILAPGIYALSANGPGGLPRPNGGRLELQLDMSLYGLAGDRAAVVIDTSSLPLSSLNVALGRTGSIRIGRGSNSIEWLTIVGNLLAAAGIETDLAGTPTTRIRVAHVVSGGSTRGVDVRNVGAAMAGRRIDAEIVDSDFSSGIGAMGIRDAVRIANFNGSHGGQIYVVMSGNVVHDSEMGCVVTNNRSNSGIISVRSSGDRFENNGVGCVVAGATVSSGTGNSNSTTFEAHGSKFTNNRGPAGPLSTGGAGLIALGADTQGTNFASNNTAVIRLWGCKFSGNPRSNFEAFGARSTAGISGTHNKVTIELHGASKFVDVHTTDSQPFEPAGTNTVSVVR